LALSSLEFDRGAIRSPRFASRPRSFAGLRFGNITPTDIDCSVDFQGDRFVFVEGKTCGAPFDDGQRRHLEYLVKGLRSGGKKAFAVVIEYPRGEDEVDYGSCLVWKWFYGDAWLWWADGQETLAAFFQWVLKL
jgi:hypothetical protein